MKRIRTILLSILALMAVGCSQGNIYNVMDYGAKGDGTTDDAAAIQKAIDECSAKGGGQVLLPSGHVFMAGPVELKSNIDLHVDVNACLLANPDESIYTLSTFGENRGEGMMWIWCDSI